MRQVRNNATANGLRRRSNVSAVNLSAVKSRTVKCLAAKRPAVKWRRSSVVSPRRGILRAANPASEGRHWTTNDDDDDDEPKNVSCGGKCPVNLGLLGGGALLPPIPPGFAYAKSYINNKIRTFHIDASRKICMQYNVLQYYCINYWLLSILFQNSRSGQDRNDWIRL